MIAVFILLLVIVRKFTFLKKITPEAMDSVLKNNGEDLGFLSEMFPEPVNFWRGLKLRAYGVNVLNEIEKTLRKLRLIFLKIEDLTGKLINRIRKSTKKHQEILEKEIDDDEEEEEEGELRNINSDVDLKQKEQLLIIEIAKNPKDAKLYNDLGNLYMRIGEYEDARNSFEKACELDPENEALKRKLARAISKVKNDKQGK